MKTIEETILENQNLIYSIAYYFTNYKNKEDLFQVGVLGMIKAYKNFDESLGVKFTTFAYPSILGEMKKYVREDRSVKVSRTTTSLNFKIEEAYALLTQKLFREPSVNELANFLEIPEYLVSEAINSRKEVQSIDAPIASDSKELNLHETIPTKSKDIDMLIALRDELGKLSDFEKELLNERYFCDKTQTETAKELGMTQVQVSRKEQKVLVKLKSKLM